MQNRNNKISALMGPISQVELLESRRLFSGYTLASLGYFTDGGQPADGLIADSSGDLFGLTQAGGDNQTGSVFEVAAGTAKPVTIASFPSTTTGSLYPNSLVLDSAGNLFGTADRGGTNETGYVFEVVKNSKTITTLASFDADNSSNSTGAYPEGNISIDANGNLFGTAVDGGQIIGATGGGTYWELKTGASTISPLAVFPTLNPTSTGAQYPSRTNFFAKDTSGNVFGVAEGNQQQGYYGYVWEIPAGTSSVNTLATFNFNNGSDPLGEIAVDSHGNVFGTTVYGGTGQVANTSTGAGTVWEVAANSGTITNLANFNTSVGYSPDGVSMDANGDLFGSANYGGTATPAEGTVWELPVGSSNLTALASFGAAGGGQLPDGGVLITSKGNLIGTTFDSGGPTGSGHGTVFELIAPGNVAPAGTSSLSPVVTKTSLPAAIVAGSSTHGTATVNVTNTGASLATGNATISVYASTTGVIDANSILLGSTTHALNTKSGGTTPVSVKIKSIPASLNGTYTLLAQSADVAGSTVNASTGPSVKISAPFISFSQTITKTTLPAAATSGQTTKATAQIKFTNNGNIVSTGTTTIAIYASTDTTVNSGILIRTFSTSVVLKPGASKTVTVPLQKIPAVPNGNYHLVAKVTDPLSNTTQTATNGTFNLAAPFISLVPSIVSTTLPASSVNGSTTKATLSLSIINNGNLAPTAGATVSVYASTDGTIGTGTLLIAASFKTVLKPAKSAKLKVSLANFTMLSSGSYFLVVQVTSTLSATNTVVSATRYSVT